jgi:hypothetical protein
MVLSALLSRAVPFRPSTLSKPTGTLFMLLNRVWQEKGDAIVLLIYSAFVPVLEAPATDPHDHLSHLGEAQFI